MPVPTPVTLAVFKEHLNIPAGNTTHDPELQRTLEAATEQAEGYIGPIVGRAVTKRLDTDRHGRIDLHPALAVTSVVGVFGAPTYAVGDLDLDPDDGLLRLDDGRGLFAGRYTVTWTAGRAATVADVPASIADAVNIIGKHLWETQRGKSARPGLVGMRSTGADDSRDFAPPRGFAIPHRALELLRPYIPVLVS